MKNLSKEMIKNIEDYSKKIKTLASFVEAVRKVPGMYIGATGNRGFLNMIREIIQNSIDEMMRRDSPCDYIHVYYDERNHLVKVLDNGRGIPVDKLIDIFTKEHTSTNYTKELGDYSSGVHGVGAKVSNALSESFMVESFILGNASRMEFINGIPKDNKPEKFKAKTDFTQGTIISFTPSYEILGEITLSGIEVLNLVYNMYQLTNIGSRIDVQIIDIEGRSRTEKFINEQGILTGLMNKTKYSMIDPIYGICDNGHMKAEFAFTYDTKDMDSDADISLFANMCPTVSGTHYDGFMEGIGIFFRNYMNKVYLPANSKLSVNINDIRTGLKCIISVCDLYPVFTGQAKDIFSNAEMKDFVKDLVLNTLENWSKTNPNDLQKLAKYFKNIAEIRSRSENEKVKIQVKYEADLSGLPKKYERPTGNKDLELIIIEGDSAAGTAKNARDFKRQGIFPLRGKIPNAASIKPAKLFQNQEIAGLVKIIGGGYGRNFDISKVKFDKIIPMTDADPDGAHIRAKLLVFFLLYMKDLIVHGRVYKAIPPLYGAKIGKHFRYFTNDLDLNQYIEKEFSKNNVLCDIYGKKLSHNHVIELLMKNKDYKNCIDTLASNYGGLNPSFLEFILINRNLSESKLKKALQKKYRFIEDVSKSNGMINIIALVNKQRQILYLNDTNFSTDMYPAIHYIEKINDQVYFKVNNNELSLYELMSVFENEKPNVQRYKGLGEMNINQLEESTIHPDGNRSLVRYTIDDVHKELEAIKYLESNKDKILTDLNIERVIRRKE